MLVEQPIDRIRPFQADCRVGAPLAFADFAYVPHGNPMRRQKREPFRIIQSQRLTEQSENNRPEQVARMGVILAPAQRLLTRERAEYEDARLRADNWRKAAFGGPGRGAAAGA